MLQYNKCLKRERRQYATPAGTWLFVGKRKPRNSRLLLPTLRYLVLSYHGPWERAAVRTKDA